MGIIKTVHIHIQLHYFCFFKQIFSESYFYYQFDSQNGISFPMHSMLVKYFIQSICTQDTVACAHTRPSARLTIGYRVYKQSIYLRKSIIFSLNFIGSFIIIYNYSIKKKNYRIVSFPHK